MSTPEEMQSLLSTVCPQYAEKIGEIMFTPSQIEALVTDLAKRISDDHRESEGVVLVGLLKGCVMFFADVSRKITVPFTCDFISVSSYSGSNSTGVITMKKDLDMDVTGKDVVIIEDLIDTGITLEWILKHFQTKGAKSVKIACLLNKEERRTVKIDVDYVGATIPNKFIVGYGMDFDEHYRNLPFVGVMKPKSN